MPVHVAGGLNPGMSAPDRYRIDVQVVSQYLEPESEPEQDRYVFRYTVRLHNRGTVGARLISRHWVITDADGQVQEVRGAGVVGETPWLAPGADYQYSSGAMLRTSVGTMHGSYQMLADDGHRFDAPIARFTLSIPRVLN